MAPVLALVGERPEALVLMRLAMVPLYLLSLWLTYLLARRLFDARVALFAAVLAGLHYEFFFKSIEFRTDDLWTVAWLAALAVLVGGPLGAGRAFAAAAALGAALAVSQKTVLLAAALVAAASFVAVLSAEVRAAFPPRRLAALAAAATAGFLALPAVLAAFFAAHGALGAAARDVIGHNVLPGLGDWKEPWRLALLPLGGLAAAWAAASGLRAAGGARVRVLRVVRLPDGRALRRWPRRVLAAGHRAGLPAGLAARRHLPPSPVSSAGRSGATHAARAAGRSRPRSCWPCS